MRMDGIGYSGMVVQPYYDSLLVKYTASGGNWEEVTLALAQTLALISTLTLTLTLTLILTLTRSCAA